MGKKQSTSNADKPDSELIIKLQRKTKINIVVAVICQIIAIAIIAGGVKGMIEAGFALLGVALFFAVLIEVFAFSLLRENKGFKKRIELERRLPICTTVFADPLYKNKGCTYSMACEIYCRQVSKKEKDLSKEDKAMIWQYSFDDFAYLLMWIIENDLYQPGNDFDEDEAQEAIEYVSRIKNREELPTDYLESYEGYFMEDSVKKKARAFVIEYFKGSYEDEVREFAKEKLNAELYGFPFRWEDYDAFKVHIDEAYKKYQSKSSDKA